MAVTALAGSTGASSDQTPTLTLKTGGGACAAGDLVIAFLGYDGANVVTSAAGFSSLVGAAFTGAAASIYYLVCAGGETSWTPTMTASERGEWIVVHIPAGEWHGTTAPEINTVATGSSTTPNPGDATPSWGTDGGVATLYIASCFADDSGAPFPITGWPTGYSLINTESAGDATSSACDVAVAAKSVSAASDNAGAFTMTATETWAAYTVMVRGAAGGATFALAGTAAGTAAMTGAVNHTYGLTGTAASVAAMVGALNHAYGLSGTAAATAAMTGDLSKAFALAGLAEAVASMVGDVTVTSSGFALAGTAAATADMAGNVVIGYTLAGSAPAVASAAGALGIGYPLAGQADGTASAAGAVSVGYSLAGMAAAVAAMSGGINHTYGLAGTAAATATLIGDLQSGVIVVGDAAIVFTQLADGSIAFTVVNLASLAFSSPHEAQLSGMATEYDRGDTTRPTVTFTVSGTATDPTTISLQVISPDKVSTTYTYGASQITKSGTGVYYRDVTLDQSGVWYFRFSGTGSVVAAAEGTVTVRA